MNLKVEEILMVIVAFIIGWFVSNMISGSSSQPIARIKKNESKHTMATKIFTCKDILPQVCQGAIHGDSDICKDCANSRRDLLKWPGGQDWPTLIGDHEWLGEIKCNRQQSDTYCDNKFKKKNS
jgi:hypothetical protein